MKIQVAWTARLTSQAAPSPEHHHAHAGTLITGGIRIMSGTVGRAASMRRLGDVVLVAGQGMTLEIDVFQ